MSDFIPAREFDGSLWVPAVDAVRLRSRLAEAEALLRRVSGHLHKDSVMRDVIDAFLAPDAGKSSD